MPTLKVTDPNSGRTLNVDYDGAPPTEAELDTVFKQTPKNIGAPSSQAAVPSGRPQPQAVGGGAMKATPGSDYAGMSPNERHLADVVSANAIGYGTNSALGEFNRSVAAQDSLPKPAPRPKPKQQFFTAPNGQKVPYDTAPDGSQVFRSKNQDPFAIQGTPIADDEAKFGGVRTRSVNGPITRVLFQNGQTGYYNGNQRTGPESWPAPAPDKMGFNDFMEAAHEGVAQGGENIKGAITSGINTLYGGGKRTPRVAAGPDGKPVQIGGNYRVAPTDPIGKNFARSAGGFVGGVATLPAQAALAGVDFAQTPKTPAQRIAMGPFGLVDPLVPKSQAAAQRTDDFQRGNIDSLSGGPHGWMAKVQRGDITGAAKDLGTAAANDPVMAAATIVTLGEAGLRGAGAAISHMGKEAKAAVAMGDRYAAAGDTARAQANYAHAAKIQANAARFRDGVNKIHDAIGRPGLQGPQTVDAQRPAAVSNTGTVPRSPSAPDLPQIPGLEPIISANGKVQGYRPAKAGEQAQTVLPPKAPQIIDTPAAEVAPQAPGAPQPSPVPVLAGAAGEQEMHHSALQPRDEQGHFDGPPKTKPIVATEARPGEGLNDPLFNLPPHEQVKLRDDVMAHSQGAAPDGKFQFYHDLGIDHSVVPADGSFRGEVTPNYLHIIHGGSMDDARFVASTEGLMNLQHAEAIMKPDPNSTEGVPGALFESADGRPLTAEDTAAVYKALNEGLPADQHIDITRIPNHGIFAGNFLDGMSADDFFGRIANAHKSMQGRYNTIQVVSDGDYIPRGKNDGIQTNEDRGYTGRLRESGHPGSAERPSDLSDRVDRDITEPRVRAYTDAARRNGIDPGPVEAQIRDAGERLKAALRGDTPPTDAQHSSLPPPEPPANAGGSSAVKTDTPKKPKPDTAGPMNLDRMNVSPEAKEATREAVTRLGYDRKAPITWDETRKSAEALGIQLEHLRDLKVGQVPVGPDGLQVDPNQFKRAVRNLQAHYATEKANAEQEYRADPSEANKAALDKAREDHDLALSHAQALSTRYGQGLNEQKDLAIPSRSETVMQSVQEAPRLADVEPPKTESPKAESVTGSKKASKPRQQQNRAAKPKDGDITKDQADAIRARLKAKRDEDIAQYGSGIKGLIKQIAHEETGAFDVDAAKDLIDLGRYHIQTGARTFGEWIAKMRADVGPELGDTDGQALYAHTHAALRADVVKKQRDVSKLVLVDQLVGRFGSRKKVSEFVDHIADTDGSNTILDAVLSGNEANLTAGQKAILQEGYSKFAKKPAQRKPSTGALKTVDTILDEGRAAKKASAGTRPPPSQNVPNASQMLDRSLGGRLGKKRADVLKADIGADVYERWAEGTQTPGEMQAIVAAYEKIRPTPGTVKPAIPAVQELNTAAKEARANAARAEREAMAEGPRAAYRGDPSYGPPKPRPPRFGQIGPKAPSATANSVYGRHVGTAKVLDFRQTLEATPEGKAALDKLDSREELTDSEKLRVAHAIDSVRQPRAIRATQKGTGDELAKTLTGIVRDARAGRLNYDSPTQMATDYLSKSIGYKAPEARLAAEKKAAGETLTQAEEESLKAGEEMKRIEAALQAVESDGNGVPTAKGRRQIAEIVNKESKQSFVDNLAHYVRSGLLSNPGTLFRIGLSHVQAVATENVLNRPLAYAIDQGIARRTGQTSIMAPGREHAKITVKNAVPTLEDLRRSGSIIAYGHNQVHLGERQVGYAEPGKQLQPEFTSKSAVANAAIRLPMRVHGALYDMIGSKVFAQAVAERAHVEAVNMARRGKIANADIAAKAKELQENPTPDILDYARDQYSHQMFTNENAIHSGIKNVTNGRPALQAVASVVLPFSKVPSNIAGRALEYTPPGAIISALDQHFAIKRGGEPMTVAQQANISRTLSRGATGAALTALGYFLYKKSIINAPDKDKFEFGSLNAFGQKWDMAGQGPIANPVLLGAGIGHAQDKTREGKPVNYFEMAQEYLAEQPLLRAQGTFDAAKTGDERGLQRLGGGLITEALPYSSALRATAAQFDPEHAVRSKSSVGDYVKNTIPGLRQTLPLTYDQQAKKVPEAGGLIGPVRHVSAHHMTAVEQKIDEVKELQKMVDDDLKKPVQRQADIDHKKVLNVISRKVGMYMSQLSKYRNQLKIGNKDAEPPDFSEEELDQAIEYMKEVRASGHK